MLSQCLQFFTTATKYEGITTLEPHHLLAFTCKLDQQAVDLLLAQRVFVASLACVNSFCCRCHKIQHTRRHQVVINNDIRLLQQAHGAQRQQLRVARTSSHQKNLTKVWLKVFHIGFQWVTPLLPQPPPLQPPLPHPPEPDEPVSHEGWLACIKIKLNSPGLSSTKSSTVSNNNS